MNCAFFSGRANWLLVFCALWTVACNRNWTNDVISAQCPDISFRIREEVSYKGFPAGIYRFLFLIDYQDGSEWRLIDKTSPGRGSSYKSPEPEEYFTVLQETSDRYAWDIYANPAALSEQKYHSLVQCLQKHTRKIDQAFLQPRHREDHFDMYPERRPKIRSIIFRNYDALTLKFQCRNSYSLTVAPSGEVAVLKSDGVSLIGRVTDSGKKIYLNSWFPPFDKIEKGKELDFFGSCTDTSGKRFSEVFLLEITSGA